MTVKEAFAVLIIILLASTLMAFQPVEATFTPAIPQFTLAIVNHAYDEPTTYTTNQFTGVTTSHGGTHYEWKTLDITITNQPVTTDGQNSLRYNIRFKGQYTEQWTENNGEGAFYPQNSSSSTTLFSYFLGGSYPGARSYITNRWSPMELKCPFKFEPYGVMTTTISLMVFVHIAFTLSVAAIVIYRQ